MPIGATHHLVAQQVAAGRAVVTALANVVETNTAMAKHREWTRWCSAFRRPDLEANQAQTSPAKAGTPAQPLSAADHRIHSNQNSAVIVKGSRLIGCDARSVSISRRCKTLSIGATHLSTACHC
jgi:hypothetical protein